VSDGRVAIRARAHPALIGLLPEPRLAAEALPDWLRAMPSEVPSPRLGGAEVRTLKHCPPLIDALSLGVLIPLACDLTVTRGEGGPVLSWDWPFPALPDQLLSRSPVGAHVPEQAAGAPLPLKGRLALKFMNFWTLSAPDGWSVLYTHPLNREDLPFRTLSGVVDADRFGDGLTHFPAIWTDESFEGVLPRGAPVAQAIPVPRTAPTLELGAQTAEESAATRALQEALKVERGVYRKRFRAKR
jgi:hypothetical protein